MSGDTGWGDVPPEDEPSATPDTLSGLREEWNEKWLLRQAGWEVGIEPFVERLFTLATALQDRAEQAERDAKEARLGTAANQYQQYRAKAVEETQRRGFEEGALQLLWRNPDCFKRPYDSGEVVAAICDALCREGCTAWNGDGTSCVEQMVRLQWDRAVKAEALLRRRRSRNGTVALILGPRPTLNELTELLCQVEREIEAALSGLPPEGREK